jgi:hypothetical protein
MPDMDMFVHVSFGDSRTWLSLDVGLSLVFELKLHYYLQHGSNRNIGRAHGLFV